MINRKLSDNMVVILGIFFTVTTFVIYHNLFKFGLNDYSQEIMTAIFGTVIIVASMLVMMKIQSKEDKEKEYSSFVFEKKLEIYKSLLDDIFKMDDDNVIDREEISNIENKIGVASLVASEKLVCHLSQFIYQLKAYGVIYRRSMVEKQKQHFKSFINSNFCDEKASSHIAKGNCKNSFKDRLEYFVSLNDIVQNMREDLSVVEGDILNKLEFFVQMKYDQFKLIKNPNVVD